LSKELGFWYIYGLTLIIVGKESKLFYV